MGQWFKSIFRQFYFVGLKVLFLFDNKKIGRTYLAGDGFFNNVGSGVYEGIESVNFSSHEKFYETSEFFTKV